MRSTVTTLLEIVGVLLVVVAVVVLAWTLWSAQPVPVSLMLVGAMLIVTGFVFGKDDR